MTEVWVKVNHSGEPHPISLKSPHIRNVISIVRKDQKLSPTDSVIILHNNQKLMGVHKVPDTDENNPILALTAVALWLSHDEIVDVRFCSPTMTFHGAIAAILKLETLSTNKWMPYCNGRFLPGFGYDQLIYKFPTESNNPLKLYETITVQVLVQSTREELKLNIAARSTISKLLTALCKKLPGTVKSEDIIITHETKEVTLNEYVVIYQLDTPFHIRHRELTLNEAIVEMKEMVHPPSKHGIRIVQAYPATEFKGISVFSHRNGHHGNHVALYCLEFENFSRNCESIQLTKEDTSFTTEYCHAMSKIYDNEDERKETSNKLLTKYFNLGKIEPNVFPNKHGPRQKDAVCDGYVEKAAIIEYKCEIGMGGCDSFIELLAYYIEDLDPELLLKSCQPRFLVEEVGPHMIVSGAVYGENVYADRLTPPVWLIVQPNDDSEMIKTARTLKALKVSCANLQQQCNESTQPRFPSFDFSGSLTYNNQIQMHMFDCTVPDHGKCVIKFVQGYCDAAHRVMFQAGYAPELLHSETHGCFIAVLMKAMEGAITVNKYLAQNPTECERILAECTKALNHLHSEGFCHGDFRPSNIFVTSSQTINIIDYDWAGKIGEVKYPMFMNHVSIKWPDTAEDGEKVTEAHDKNWLNALKSQFQQP